MKVEIHQEFSSKNEPQWWLPRKLLVLLRGLLSPESNKMKCTIPDIHSKLSAFVLKRERTLVSFTLASPPLPPLHADKIQLSFWDFVYK